MGGGPADSFDFGDCKTAECTIIIEGMAHACDHLAVGQALLPQRDRDMSDTENVLSHVGSCDSHSQGAWFAHLGSQLGALTCRLKAMWPTGGGASLAVRLARPLPHTGG